MKHHILALAMMTGAVLVSLGRASAQTGTPPGNCAPRQAVLERLADTYGETRQSIGLASNNTVVEVFASGDSGSWTIIVTNARGLTCLVAAGRSFETLSEDPTQAALGDPA